MTPEQLDTIAGWAGLVLTLMVFSYLLSDNFLYRVAVHVMIGTAAGYVAIAAVTDIIVPWFNTTIVGDDIEPATRALGTLPIIIATFLLLKSLPRYAHVGNFGVLVVAGIGTGVALVGTVLGTIIPLVRDAGNSMSTQEESINGLLMVIGTITTLAYFQYISRQRPFDPEPSHSLPVRIMGTIGKGFIVVTLGALYAGAILTSLTIFDQLLADHVRFLLEQVGG